MANLDQVARVAETTIATGPAAGMRVIDVAVVNGLAIRVLPDRGFDIGAAWFAGVPLAWLSEAGERPPLESLEASAWIDAFGGGLVTTCGLRNVGAPSEGHGLHGAISHQLARDVRIRRHIFGDTPVITMAATIDEPGDDEALLRIERRIIVPGGRGALEIQDITTNLGPRAEPAPLLYHVNVGHPLLNDDAELDVPGSRAVPRDAISAAQIDAVGRMPAPAPGTGEAVFEHELDDSSRQRAVLTSRPSGLELTVSWRRAELPRFHQWVRRDGRWYVLGLEPANCSVLGRGADRAQGRLPILRPGERRRTRLRINVRRLDPARAPIPPIAH
ncbi:MAG TPA: DUF4432 family protein [Patescibacteria group bacterium]|nr:DUF4432 family protein [Patescibacteria group bacterium]